jgi:hypothetical protein
MPTIGLLVKTPDGVVVGQAVIGETGRITATLDNDYFIALREALLKGFADDICIAPNLIPAERAVMNGVPLRAYKTLEEIPPVPPAAGWGENDPKKEKAAMDDKIKPTGEAVENYMDRAKALVHRYVVDHLNKSDPTVDFDVYVVWFSKTLQNWKALVSTTLPDKMYYEVTYDGDLGQAYLDAYVKIDNVCIKDQLDPSKQLNVAGDDRIS